MSINWKSKLLTLAAVTTLYAALLPGTVSAQTLASAGSDLYTRLLWKTSNGSVSLWLLDPAMNYVSYRAYGPYLGWEPLGISTGADNYTRMLWKYTDGTISLWLLDRSIVPSGRDNPHAVAQLLTLLLNSPIAIPPTG